jgi:hypothetical protein
MDPANQDFVFQIFSIMDGRMSIVQGQLWALQGQLLAFAVGAVGYIVWRRNGRH